MTNSKHQKGKEMLSKKNRARFLIVVKGYSQREASALIGVSERTMCVWGKKYHWKEASDKELLKLGGLTSIMEGFIKYVKSTAPAEIGSKVERLWNKYLESIEQGTGNM